MITLIKTPAAVINAEVSPEEVSYLVATDAPVVFEFERKEGTVTTAADQGGDTRLTLTAGHSIVDGDQIGIYDAGADRMIQATVTIVSTNVFDTDLAWMARYATDLNYVLSYTQRPSY